MSDVLRQLAVFYRASAAGKRGAQNDYIIEYEKFLSKAALDDGDAREIAESQLQAAEVMSGGRLVIDRHKKTRTPLRIRISKDGGEAWLFAQAGGDQPSVVREQLAAFFTAAANRDVPAWSNTWRVYFHDLADRARRGDSIQPFKACDTTDNETLINALTGVVRWKESALIRYASSQICGNSKLLEQLEQRILQAAKAITGHTSLEAFGIHRKPRSVTIHGPLCVTINDQQIDFSNFPAPVSLFEDIITQTTTLSSAASICLTVENEDTFHELARRHTGILLVQTSFAGAATLLLLKRLPDTLRFYHFGDSDPAGSEILHDLCERSGHKIAPLKMAYRPRPDSRPLNTNDRKTIVRLLASGIPQETRGNLEAILASGQIGDFEQESIPIEEVLRAIHTIGNQSEFCCHLNVS